ncbi:hypothetical protein N431DRAFT_363157 [Stipitochalara longipes BDJ]|nr:hypothetical protein N431DRAFT_363157 [Stipitochalara longipes BDJ]
MARLRFLVPSLMCGGILLGILVAIAHHLFYQSLNTKIVHSENQQQWFLRIGTGLAILTKTLLTTSAALAYTQVLWHTLRLRPVSLNNIDSLFSATTNAWHFTNWEFWKRGPALAIIALIIWTLPIIAVVTPATLTVQPAAQPNETTLNFPIPAIDYGIPSTQKFALIGQGGPLQYSGPSPRIVRLMSSITSQGSISQISAPFPNCTYSIPFYGPSLSCGAPAIGGSLFQEDVGNLIYNTTCHQGSCDGASIIYVSYVPQIQSANTTLSAATLLGLNDTLSLFYANVASTVSLYTFDMVSNDHARLFATVPKLETNETNLYQPSWYQTIECGLYNTSYVVNFTFVNGQQNITITNKTQLNGVSNQLSYSICEESEGSADEPCSGPVLGYMSLLDALDNILMGFLTNDQYNVIGSTRTQITNTVLMETMELQGLLNAGAGLGGIKGLSEPLSIANMTMSKALEEIIQNATLSLFSDSYFLQNSSTTPIRPITVSTPQNAYVYNRRNLFIAYGLGILISITLVIVGLICIWASGDSFGASFSAILRTTRNVQLDAIVPAKETHGTFPMSKELGSTKLILRKQVCEEGMRTAFIVVGAAVAPENKVEGMELTKRAARRMSFDSLLER